MQYWTQYEGHKFNIRTVPARGRRKPSYDIDETIYTFDIETTSYFIDDIGQIHAPDEYEKYRHGDKKNHVQSCGACLYVWQLGINDNVYYGRTHDELLSFLSKIDENNNHVKKIFWIHNLAFEFSFLYSFIPMTNVFARKERKPMRAESTDYNIEFRCSFQLANCKLESLPKNYDLPVEKLTGELDYNLIRTPATPLTDRELLYCENDCLVLYHYIKKELQTYGSLDRLPMTSTGKVRAGLHEIVDYDENYKKRISRMCDRTVDTYNAQLDVYAGGYTHANRYWSGELIKGVTSYDFTSSYPYVMLSEKYPRSYFKPIANPDRLTIDKMINGYAYMLHIRFEGLQAIIQNTLISASKTTACRAVCVDNGRIISADYIEIWVTETDLEYIQLSYSWADYKILEGYYAPKDYLPLPFINYILDLYNDKTKYKGVAGSEGKYAISKAMFNALYGMCVTNDICNMVIFDGRTWAESPIDVQKKLNQKIFKGFLAFSTGVWVCSYARRNLLINVCKLDDHVIYCDTDSMKLLPGFDESVIIDYNNDVEKKLAAMAAHYNIDPARFAPEDCKGKKHLIGIFDKDAYYEEFITLGAKKYAALKDGKICLTLAGVNPKSGAKRLNKVSDFKDGLYFGPEYTKNLTHFYIDDQAEIELTDYTGLRYKVKDRSGIALMPCGYLLGQSSVRPDLEHNGRLRG